MHEPVKIFSGGEKSRLALALIIWQKPNLLLLDEPTNHLDLEMRQALSLALQDYEGAMILVSHDRFLVRSTVDQLMLVANHELSIYDGDLDDYERWLFQFRKETHSTSKQPILEASPKIDSEEREQRKAFIQEIKKCEIEMEKLQKQLDIIEKKLSENTLYEELKKQELHDLLREQSSLQHALQENENVWLKATEALEKKIA